MPSKILYDTRTLEILVCQPKPRGIGLPSFNGLCKSARIPENQKQFMAELRIDEDMLTREAKKRLKIIASGEEMQVARKSQQELLEAERADAEEINQVREKKRLMKEFIVALLEDDQGKIDEIKAEYKTISR